MKCGAPGSALLVIAGAGSGKTNTVAHRVAHLMVNGADPRRILLMTFSRRAAAEMTRRVERIARQVMDSSAGVMTEVSHSGVLRPSSPKRGICRRRRRLTTSAQGQIYIPQVNWLLLIAVLGLVLGFQSSSALA